MSKIFDLQSPIATAVTMEIDVPTGGVDAGEFITRNDVSGFPLVTTDPYGAEDESIESNPKYTLITRAEKVRALKAAGAINEGEYVYYDSGDGKINAAPTGNTYCGYALESVASAATSIMICFIGDNRDAS